MYLKRPKEVTRAARPSRMTATTHSTLDVLAVKAHAADDSFSLNEIPAWAALKAPQSLAPSPHIAETDECNDKIEPLAIKMSSCFLFIFCFQF